VLCTERQYSQPHTLTPNTLTPAAKLTHLYYGMSMGGPGGGRHLSEAEAQLGGEHVGEGHELRGLVGGVTEHVSLVTSTDLL